MSRRQYVVLRSGIVLAIILCLGYGWWYWEWQHERIRVLHNAAVDGNIYLVRASLDSGVPPDATNFHSRSALDGAALSGQANIVQLLLERGANPHTALHSAASRGRADILAMLLTRGATVSGPVGAPILCTAVDSGNLATVNLLLQQGADINTPDKEGMLAIQHATSCRNAALFGVLVDHGADLTARASDGRTVLMFAAGNGNASACRYLIRHGAEVNARDKEGKTALIYAVYFNREEESANDLATLDMLLKSGADPSAKDRHGRTALSYAAEFRNAKAKVRLRCASSRQKE